VVRSAGSHQLVDGLESDRQGAIAGLTRVEKYVTLRLVRGHEAEDVLRDIIALSDRLITLVGKLVDEEEG